MGRPHRLSTGGRVYHAVNRGVHRQALFETSKDFDEFQRLMGLACERIPMRIVAHCEMYNHWHLVLWPDRDGALSAYLQWLTGEHARQFNRLKGLAGDGHVYSGRFYSSAVEDERHLWSVLRYVERNPVSAGLVHRAEEWPWSSLRRSKHFELTGFPRPEGWLDLLVANDFDTT